MYSEAVIQRVCLMHSKFELNAVEFFSIQAIRFSTLTPFSISNYILLLRLMIK